jgi:hypothetical protein
MPKNDPMASYYNRRFETIKLERPPADGRERVARPLKGKKGYEWVTVEELLAVYLAKNDLKIVSANEPDTKAPADNEAPKGEPKAPELEAEKAPRRTRKPLEENPAPANEG